MNNISLQYVSPDEAPWVKISSALKGRGAHSVIYVCLNRPHEEVERRLQAEGLGTRNIFFIDCVSSYVMRNGAHQSLVESPNALHVNSPSDVTSIGIALTQALKGMKGEKSIVFDSFSTLMVYVGGDVASRFGNFMINRLRKFGVGAQIIMLSTDEGKDASRIIASLSDEVKK